ncbi:hypothetical protein C1645_763695 [Glomus cerebriforme]|uniref:Uncharacterized protein n=1 Tax=Glomus cerebriforme TaxID=658196 RepID=A0A397T3Q3_9GLOM|nr:hypothetical protein C1645_763695 [Glomus cerebriforme]
MMNGLFTLTVNICFLFTFFLLIIFYFKGFFICVLVCKSDDNQFSLTIFFSELFFFYNICLQALFHIQNYAIYALKFM